MAICRATCGAWVASSPLTPPFWQYTSRAAQLYKQQLEKDALKLKATSAAGWEGEGDAAPASGEGSSAPPAVATSHAPPADLLPTAAAAEATAGEPLGWLN